MTSANSPAPKEIYPQQAFDQLFDDGSQRRYVLGSGVLKLVTYSSAPPLAATPGGGHAQAGLRYFTIGVQNLRAVAAEVEAAQALGGTERGRMPGSQTPRLFRRSTLLSRPQRQWRMQRQRLNMVKLRHDANELASLAQSIPQDVNQTAKGILPGDLNAKLKKIEKLAKQLRSQLTP